MFCGICVHLGAQNLLLLLNGTQICLGQLHIRIHDSLFEIASHLSLLIFKLFDSFFSGQFAIIVAFSVLVVRSFIVERCHMTENIKFFGLLWLVKELEMCSLTMLSDLLGICRAECVKVNFIWHDTNFLEHHLDFPSKPFDDDTDIIQINYNV